MGTYHQRENFFFPKAFSKFLLPNSMANKITKDWKKALTSTNPPIPAKKSKERKILIKPSAIKIGIARLVWRVLRLSGGVIPISSPNIIRNIPDKYI